MIERRSRLETLSITIPAYNEEAAIESILSRSLEAKEALMAKTRLRDVEIIVVSDGSTDRTTELVESFVATGQVKLIVFPGNCGYGAALKRGFDESRGDLVAFIDADGTCDPQFFVPLVRACTDEGADIACGCRLTPTSKMPRIRWLGNVCFRNIINFLAKTKLRDVASGMRVIRKRSLAKLYPLPNGLHFTPAMSCRAAMDKRIRIVELDMHYEERIGHSKLNVVRDGLRSLAIIFDVALTYRPFRVFGIVALLLLGLALFLGSTIAHAKWISPGYAHLPKWYLLRMATALTATTAGLSVAMIGLVAERIAALVQQHQPPASPIHRWVLEPLRSRRMMAIGILCVVAGVLLNQGTLREWFATGHITIADWWSYVMTGAFLVITGVQLAAFSVLDRIIDLLRYRREFVLEISDGREEAF